MTPQSSSLKKVLLNSVVLWFQSAFRTNLTNPIETQFPNFPLPSDVQAVLNHGDKIGRIFKECEDDVPISELSDKLSDTNANYLPLFKQLVVLYRRHRAAETELFKEKTFHPEMVSTLEEDVLALDRLTNEAWFREIPIQSLPKLKDFFPVQFIESATNKLIRLPERQYDEKFHILQAPQLFLPDLAYFRAKCEDRGSPLAIAFLDIDNFKQFNTKHAEPVVDRIVLPQFMQTIEAHVFHHGYAYRQGGDEYLMIVPSLSRSLSVEFLDELRGKLADLKYPGIEGQTTVSVGLCVVEPDCHLTDRELLDRASLAKKLAKEQGRNRIATYKRPRFEAGELTVVRPHIE
jgi:diguanylate cyclase (GGDEF)-like protein